MKYIEAIISSLRVAMTDARQNESHFESWMILNEAICDAIDALAEQPAQQEPVAVGSLDSLKLSMQHSAWDGVIQLSDALQNIDDFAKEQPAQTDWEAVAADQAMTIALLKAEQPAQQEPIWFWTHPTYGRLYKQPPAQRTWVGLTDEERNHTRQTVTYSQLAMTAGEWAEKVQIETERRLKEKNSD